MSGKGSADPALATRTLSPVCYLRALFAVVFFASGCGAEGAGELGLIPETAPSTVSPAGARAGFVVAAGGDRALAGLSETELGCVVDELLIVLEPAEVVDLTATGPTPAQTALFVDALRSCDLVLEVARLGLTGGFVGNSNTPGLDPSCVLEGVTEDDMAPLLEALFAGTETVETARNVDVLLSKSPVMGNLVRCGLRGLLGGADGEVALFCREFFNQVATMMTAVVEHGMTNEADVVDPILLTELFGLSAEVFIWLSDNVPDDHRADAKTVSDASVKVSEMMGEALQDFDNSSDPQVVFGAVFGAVARLDAELAIGSSELESARSRLESYVTSTCGDSATGLFDVIAGAGALSGA